MLEELKKALGDKVGRIGILGPSFLALSTIVGGFVKGGPTDELPSAIHTFFAALAWMFFAFGLLIICLRLVSHVFTSRPAKGLIDGMAAGVLAGLLGGFLGYAGVSSFQIAGFEPIEYNSSWSRMLSILMFSIPFGGIVGMCMDFAHPAVEFKFRNFIGPVLLGFFSTATCLGVLVSYFAPIQEGPGIQFWHIQVIAEVYIFCFLGIVILERDLPRYQILNLLITVGLSIVFWRMFASFWLLDHPFQPLFPDETLPKVSLSQYFAAFLIGRPEGLERYSSAHIEGSLDLLMMSGLPIFWILSTYFLAWRVTLRFKFSGLVKR